MHQAFSRPVHHPDATYAAHKGACNHLRRDTSTLRHTATVTRQQQQHVVVGEAVASREWPVELAQPQPFPLSGAEKERHNATATLRTAESPQADAAARNGVSLPAECGQLGWTVAGPCSPGEQPHMQPLVVRQLWSQESNENSNHTACDVNVDSSSTDSMQTMRLQQQHANSTDDSLERLKDITRSLRSSMCTSFEQLANIIEQHGPSMDGHAITACFSAAAGLARRQEQLDSCGKQQQQDLTVVQLLQLLQPKLAMVDAKGLQVIFYALAVLKFRDEGTILQLEAALAPVAHQLVPARLCQLMWSLGQLGVKPQPQLLRQILHSSGRGMGVLQGQDLCQLLHGLVQLRVQLPQPWLDLCCARVLQLCAHQQLQPQALCSLLHSLASLVHQHAQHHQQQEHPEQQAPSLQADGALPRPLLQSMLRATQQALQHAAAGAAAPQQDADDSWQQQQQQQHHARMPQRQGLQQQLPHLVGYQVVSAGQAPVQHRHLQAHQAQAMAVPTQAVQATVDTPAPAVPTHLHQQEPEQEERQWKHRRRRQPHPGEQQQHQQQWTWMPTQRLTPAGLNMLADALRLLKTDPPPDWQEAYVAAAQQLMQCSDSRNLPLTLAPLVRWRVSPGEAWLQQYLAACEGLLPSMQAQGLAVLGQSLVALQVQPSAAWLCSFLVAADNTRLAATPQGCSFLIHILGSWQQLGCLHLNRPAAAGAGQAAGAAAGQGTEAAGTAAAGQQQQQQLLARSLLTQCLQCFMDGRTTFNPEQLGMFCKGLALVGLRGTPQLASRLHQVVLQRLSHQTRPAAQRHRLTATTLCNVLMALVVACPAAATPPLMARLWAAWSTWLLPTTTPAQSAAVAWATAQLPHVQVPQAFVQGLVQQLAVTAGEADLQHLAIVVLQAKQGCWPVQQQHMQVLLGHMLQKQAAELSAVVQGQACAHQAGGVSSSSAGDAVWCANMRTSEESSSTTSSTKSSSSGSGSVATTAVLFGWSNHRLKAWGTAAAAAAAWRHIMSPEELRSALRVNTACVAVLPSSRELRLRMHAHIKVLEAAVSHAAASSGHATSHWDVARSSGVAPAAAVC